MAAARVRHAAAGDPFVDQDRGDGSGGDHALELPSHSGHRPEGRHGGPCHRRPTGSVSTAPERLASECLPARAGSSLMRDGLGLGVLLYLADLDAIEGRPADIATSSRDWSLTGVELWLDAGVRDRRGLGPLVGLDPGSMPARGRVWRASRGPDGLAEILERVGAGSRDLQPRPGRRAAPDRSGAPMGGAAMPTRSSRRAVDCRSPRVIILLDLWRVGTGRGIGTRSCLTGLRTRAIRGSRSSWAAGFAGSTR